MEEKIDPMSGSSPEPISSAMASRLGSAMTWYLPGVRWLTSNQPFSSVEMSSPPFWPVGLMSCIEQFGSGLPLASKTSPVKVPPMRKVSTTSSMKLAGVRSRVRGRLAAQSSELAVKDRGPASTLSTRKDPSASVLLERALLPEPDELERRAETRAPSTGAPSGSSTKPDTVAARGRTNSRGGPE